MIVVPALLKNKASSKKIRFQMIVQSTRVLTNNADVRVVWTNAANEAHEWTGKLQVSASNNHVGHVVCKPTVSAIERAIADDDLGTVTVTVTGELPLDIPNVPVVSEVDP